MILILLKRDTETPGIGQKEKSFKVTQDDEAMEEGSDDLCGHVACCNKVFPGGYWPEFKRSFSIAWPLVRKALGFHAF